MQFFNDIMNSWGFAHPQMKILMVSLRQLQVQGEDVVRENCKVTDRATDSQNKRVFAIVYNK